MNDKIFWRAFRELPEERISHDRQAAWQGDTFCNSAHLVLWVDHERPSASLRDQNAVLGGHSVPGKTLGVPLADDVRVAQDVDQAEAGADWDVEFLAVHYPLLCELEEKREKNVVMRICIDSPLILKRCR